jgi:hypothetical protein
LHKAIDRFINPGTTPKGVAKMISKEVTINNPELRYLVGNNEIQMIEARKRASDQECSTLVKQHHPVR